MGSGLSVETKLKILDLKLRGRMDEVDQIVVANLVAKPGMGSVAMLRSDGSQAPGSPFNLGGIYGPWGAAIDGNDHVWISNFVGRSITQLCGARTETCPPGMKTGDPISPPGGYVGGDMMMLTDVERPLKRRRMSAFWKFDRPFRVVRGHVMWRPGAAARRGAQMPL